MSVCVCVWACAYHDACEEVRGHLLEISSFLLKWNMGIEIWSPSKPSHWHLVFVNKCVNLSVFCLFSVFFLLYQNDCFYSVGKSWLLSFMGNLSSIHCIQQIHISTSGCPGNSFWLVRLKAIHKSKMLFLLGLAFNGVYTVSFLYPLKCPVLVLFIFVP